MSRLVVSSNEVDALAKKAAKGAGMPWGLAAEAGKATASRALAQLALVRGDAD